MPDIQWTTELVALAAGAGALLAVLGFVLAMILQGRRLAALREQLAQVRRELEQAVHNGQQLQLEIRQLGEENHARAVEESTLRAQLGNARDTEQRLNNELNERKEALAAQGKLLEDVRQQGHGTEKQLEAAQVELRSSAERLEDRRKQLAEMKQNLEDQLAAYKQLQERHHSLDNEHTELKTTLQRKEEHFREQMQQLADSRQSLTKEFENLANKIFEEKGKTFTHTSQASIDTMLKPFREQIEGFQKRVNEVHDASLKGNSSLNAEIRKVLEIGLQMSAEANNLTSALKGDSQQRGAWGEAQLRRTLEMSGLMEDAHYEVQSSFRDKEGRQKQTDYLVKLPDGKHIIIDSKVTLNAYDRAVGAETPEEYQLAMLEHDKAVRKHIDDLSAKDYTNLVGMRSPSFVLMFMPIEPAYIEALKHNKDLFEYGYKKGIVLVSHTTLIPILRTVSNLWMMERSNAEAREISEKAGDIFNQVRVVAERLKSLGGSLSTASKQYDSTLTALAGQQGLYGKVDRFSQLSAKVSKSLPPLEPIHADFETERLALIVEPIEEEQEEPDVARLEVDLSVQGADGPVDAEPSAESAEESETAENS